MRKKVSSVFPGYFLLCVVGWNGEPLVDSVFIGQYVLVHPGGRLRLFSVKNSFLLVFQIHKTNLHSSVFTISFTKHHYKHHIYSYEVHQYLANCESSILRDIPRPILSKLRSFKIRRTTFLD